ncbi:MAG TPA: helix-turn-helix domain-containing protein [Galbitalea sp.]|jgi:predicted ArsR family transcriptional regulator|nr:helix-turn-helix domain-containing protein [Galbitalea sp.]
MGAWEDADDAEQARRARALASPLRMRILRLCLHEARTNKELADELGVNPGTLLHHIRTLVDTGFLAPGDPRRGPRGAREVPYLATRRSWRSGGDDISLTLIETFLQEIEGLPPDRLHTVRLGLKLNAANRDELLDRFQQLFEEYKDRPADVDGDPISLFFVEHPELSRAQRRAAS